MSLKNILAIILASKGEFEGDEKKKSIIKVMNFKSWWDKNREWQLELPRREIAECVCASVDTVAVATSERYIRVLSHGGAQLKLLSVPGQIVTISAWARQPVYKKTGSETEF
jgi:hypothetical protein